MGTLRLQIISVILNSCQNLNNIVSDDCYCCENGKPGSWPPLVLFGKSNNLFDIAKHRFSICQVSISMQQVLFSKIGLFLIVNFDKIKNHLQIFHDIALLLVIEMDILGF